MVIVSEQIKLGGVTQTVDHLMSWLCYVVKLASCIEKITLGLEDMIALNSHPDIMQTRTVNPNGLESGTCNSFPWPSALICSIS